MSEETIEYLTMRHGEYEAILKLLLAARKRGARVEAENAQAAYLLEGYEDALDDEGSVLDYVQFRETRLAARAWLAVHLEGKQP